MRRFAVGAWMMGDEPVLDFEAVPSGNWVEWADVEAVMKERDLLRAECEAARAAFVHTSHSWIRLSDNPHRGLWSGETIEAWLKARQATDEAGILKGATNANG